jgi:hypothetical protein
MQVCVIYHLGCRKDSKQNILILVLPHLIVLYNGICGVFMLQKEVKCQKRSEIKAAKLCHSKKKE